MKVSLITLRPDSFDFGVTTLHHAIVFYYLEDDFLPGCNDIFLMHRLLGTPNEQVWPGVSKLVNWHEYPQWKPQPLSSSVPNLDENGLNLLAEMLHYEPSRRISAKKAMEHPYFDDLDKSYL
nr:cell division control protein 2 homolog D [Ipomoea batatas]